MYPSCLKKRDRHVFASRYGHVYTSGAVDMVTFSHPYTFSKILWVPTWITSLLLYLGTVLIPNVLEIPTYIGRLRRLNQPMMSVSATLSDDMAKVQFYWMMDGGRGVLWTGGGVAGTTRLKLWATDEMRTPTLLTHLLLDLCPSCTFHCVGCNKIQMIRVLQCIRAHFWINHSFLSG